MAVTITHQPCHCVRRTCVGLAENVVSKCHSRRIPKSYLRAKFNNEPSLVTTLILVSQKQFGIYLCYDCIAELNMFQGIGRDDG